MIERNRALDGLRGVAVILTYLVHFCGSYMATFRGANPNTVALAGWPDLFDKIMYWLFRSHHGVYIFFLLSGFLIAKLALKENFSYWRFVRNRLTRIYPAFLLALILCGCIGYFVHISIPGWREILSNLVFLNGIPSLGVTGIVFNNVTWSLFYEMIFYLTFPLVIMAARTTGIPIFSATIVAGVLIAYGPSLIGFYAEFFLFLFGGALIGLLSIRDIKTISANFPDGIVLLLYGMVISLATMGYLSTSQFVWLFAGLGFLILCKVIADDGLLGSALGWRPLAALGRMSYSFYLLHSIPLAILFTFWWRLAIPRLGTIINVVYLGSLGFVGAVVLGYLSYLVAERFYFQNHRPVDLATPPKPSPPISYAAEAQTSG